MHNISWNLVKEANTIPAKPEGGYWTMALEFVQGAKKIKIVAKGEWKYEADDYSTCGPDGAPASYIAQSMCINPKAPVGALIGKVGGSTADTKGTKDFVVGRFCVVSLGSEDAGPLFLTINDLPAGYEDNSGKLDLEIYLGN